MKLEELKNKSIAILGFGKEGKSTLDFLIGLGNKNITILDKKDIELDKDRYSNILKISGEFYLDNLENFDVIIKTPGISPYHPKIKPYKEKLTSQTEIFFSNYGGKVIGVTATKGKSTTVSLLYTVLQNAEYTIKLVGNIGNPVLDEVNILDSDETYDYIVYEMSSYMLEGFIPKLFIGFLGNIFRCHIDWHNSCYHTYQSAKINVLINSKNSVINSEYKHYLDSHKINSKNITFFGEGREIYFSKGNFYYNNTIINNDHNIVLQGEHNRVNITGVMAILEIIAPDSNTDISSLFTTLFSTLETFEGLPHRIQTVGVHNGITFVDDSIATTPDATLAAIKTFSPNIGTIFLGGFDYGFEFKDFAQSIKDYNIKNIVFFPVTGKDIKKELDAISYEYNSIETDSMQEAVEFAFKNCKNGEVSLLSCASPSFSMYNNYVERGYDFKKKVETFKNS